jgi:hypothetical protein
MNVLERHVIETFARRFIEDCSQGEWQESLIQKDVDKLTAGIVEIFDLIEASRRPLPPTAAAGCPPFSDKVLHVDGQFAIPAFTDEQLASQRAALADMLTSRTTR